MTLRDDVLAIKINCFLELAIKGDFKVIINCYNKKSNLLSSIILLMKDIWRLSYNLNIHKYSNVYKKINKIADCLTKKNIYNDRF